MIKYGIVAVKRSDEDPNLADILHFCGYSERPTPADFDSLKQELETDPELGLVGQMEGVVLIEADEAVMSFFAEELRDADPTVLSVDKED